MMRMHFKTILFDIYHILNKKALAIFSFLIKYKFEELI